MFKSLVIYFLFILITSLVLNYFVTKRENYEDVVDHNIDLLLYDIKKEISKKFIESFSNIDDNKQITNTGSIGQYYSNSLVDTKFEPRHDISTSIFKSGPAPDNIMIRSDLEESVEVSPYDEYKPFLDNFYKL
jgi:hypothetical protein